jgi:hypothetical protein
MNLLGMVAQERADRLCRYDFRNKSVGVVGNGSSGIQIVPKLQSTEGLKLTCFMRSPTWISGSFGDTAMLQLGLDPSQTECKLRWLGNGHITD